jgi:molybdopterin converting factor small subunit
MTVRVVFYGGLKQEVGTKEQTLTISRESLTVRQLGILVRERYPALNTRLATVAYVVNDEVVDPGYVLRDGDEAALLPPVSGG